MIILNEKLKNSRTGKDIPEFETTVKIVMTDTELSFEFFCKNSKFFSASNEYNGPIFDGDVCEAFICTGEDPKKYFEIEVSPNNTQFVSFMTNLGPGLYDAEYVSKENNFLKSEVEFLGNDYRLKFSMPLEKIGYDPKRGIRFNAYRIETEGGYTDRNLLALNPTMCDTFHVYEKFVELK